MAKEYIVEKAFQGSVSKEDKTPVVIKTKAGDCHKYLVKFKGEGDKGWIQILRKITDGESEPVSEGDSFYGDLAENNWGKYDFHRQRRPEGQLPPQNAKSQKSSGVATSNVGNLEAKLDYIIGILEHARWFVPNEVEKPKDFVPETIDDKPVDLSELDY